MSLPINRTAKSTLDTNLVNGNTSDAPAVKASNDVVYNTIDELYNYSQGLINAGILTQASVSPTPNKVVQRDTSGNIAGAGAIFNYGASIKFNDSGGTPQNIINHLNGNTIQFGNSTTPYMVDSLGFNIIRATSGGFKMESASGSTVLATAGTSVTTSITFPTAFSGVPVVIAAPTGASGAQNVYINVIPGSPTATGFTLAVTSGVAQTIPWAWIAIGN